MSDKRSTDKRRESERERERERERASEREYGCVGGGQKEGENLSVKGMKEIECVCERVCEHERKRESERERVYCSVYLYVSECVSTTSWQDGISLIDCEMS